MPRFSELARITASRIGGNADEIDDTLLVWQALVTYAERHDYRPSVYHQNRLGYSMEVSVWKIIESLWPGADEEFVKTLLVRCSRADALHMLTRARPEQGRPPTFWVSATPPAPIPLERAPMSTTERKLSPTEAGEDRPPGEVTTSQVPKPLTQYIAARSSDHTALLDLIVDTVHRLDVPATSREMWELVREATSMGASTIAKACQALVDQGRLFYRFETPKERLVRGDGQSIKGGPARLYWHGPEIPIRDHRPAGTTPIPTPDWGRGKKYQSRGRVEARVNAVEAEVNSTNPFEAAIAALIDQREDAYRRAHLAIEEGERIDQAIKVLRGQ